MKPIRNALTSSSTLYSRIALASVLTLGSIGQALALPEDPTVVSGNITFNSSDPRHLIIQQLTQRGIIDWRSFNISADEWVQFQQPGATSVTLNRVFGGNPTEILGRLSANGNVMIVNPNGILFGAGSQVDVAGLVATTADITNANFNAGRYNFDIPGRANASVINHGNITVADKGLVALVAPGVSNTGVITARMGTVQLGAAETFTVDMYGDGLYSFGLGKKTSVKALDENGNELDAAVSNSGTISAQGGSVYLTANAAGEVLNNAVNNTGVIEATSLRNEGGVIVLDGGEGNVQVAGTLNASGKNAGEKGGKIQVTGKNIKLASATVDASGAAGGGTVQIGGEAVGKGSSKTVVVDENSTINVSATNNGDGGTAIIWSDDHTDFKGTILGNGGINGGNGGFAEVSSHNMLTYNGLADLRATNGEMGTLLLDPMNIVVDNAMAAAISATLAASNVILDTSGPGPDVGNITVNGNIISGGTGNLTLLADNDIILNSVISLAFGDLILDATRDIIMNAATVSVDDFSAVAGGEVSLFGSIIASANNIIINNTGRFFSDTSNVLLANNSVQLNQSTAGSIQNAIDAINPVAASSLLHLHDGTWNENVNIDLANLTLEGNGWLNTIIRAFGAPAAVVDINAANVTLRNLGVDGLNNATNGVNADFANNVTISGVDVFRTTSHGFEINNGNNFSLTGNRSRFTGGSGIYVFNGQDFDLTSNQMFFNGNHAIEIAFSVDFDLFDNRMSNTVGDGINIDNSRFFTVDQSNIRFTGGNGIAISNSQDFSVTNGLIQDTGDHAIDLTDSKRFTVTDNEIKAVTGNGINMLRTSSATVSGNEIGQASGHGMAIDNSFLFNIIRNQFNGIGLNGVWVNFSSYFNIDGNSLNNVDAHGIHITDRSNHFGVDGNNLTRIADNGINIADAFTFDLTDNTMRFVDGKGIAVARSRDFDLVDNTVRDTGDHAFDIIISRLFDMTGNLVERSAGRGVNISESNNFDVADNTIKQTTGDGIGVRQSFLFDLIHNTISSVAANAIDITFSSYFNVLSNQMFFAGHGINIWDRSNNFLLDDNRMSYLTGHGININNAFTFDANNSNIRYTGGRGINIADSRDFGLDDNAIRNSGTDSIGVSDSEDFGITHNFSRDSGADAIIVENSENFDVDDNTLLFSGANGITVINGVDFGITGNRINQANGYGIFVDPSFFFTVYDNTVSWTDLDGLFVTDSAFFNLEFNKIFFVGGHALSVANSGFFTVYDNRMSHTAGNGISVDGSSIFNIDTNNMRFISGNGIDVTGSSDFTVVGNFIRDITNSGISIFNSNLFSVANNLVDVALNGMFLDSNGGGNSVTDNNVRNTSIGIHNLNTDATGFASNTISNNGTGVLVEDSDDVTFLGDNILANTTGMQLDNSDNTFIDSVDFTGNTTHLFISNGSGGTLVTNTDFAGGDTGVLIDGAGSSMQFAGNTSTFTGQNFYFILQNGAMVGDTLDASQQFFEGIRAADFTLAERDAAEARTLDTEDGIVTIGNVFYKDFPAPPPVTFNFNGAGLDEFQQREDDVFPQGLFSYAGQTLTNDITENQQNFRMQQLDLSLLGEGGINDVPTSPPGGVELANLTPEQMANLTPAAGGTSSGEPQQIAELSPSAGGNCGNSFLGAGYEVGFSNVTCSTTEVQ